MKLHSATIIAAFAIMSLAPITKAAEAPAIPDFSGGIPGATLEKREQNKASETFHLKTDLSSKEFFKSLRTTLGDGWRLRKLNEEEMILSASKARSKSFKVSLYDTVSLSVFEHSKFPSVNIRVMHFKHKKENTGASAEIRVIRPTEKTSDILYSKPVVFKEFHDPGRLISANGKEYWFHYKGFTHDNIKTWEEGRKLHLTYSNTKGSQLHDPLSGASARVGVTDIIKEITRKRAKTVGAAWAYRDEYELWDAMITRLLKELEASRTPDEYKDIEAMHNSWLKYKEMRFKVGVSEFGHRSGTITIIESNARAVTAIKHQALFLRSLALNDEYPLY